MKSIEQILKELKRNNFVDVFIDMNNTSSDWHMKATHWIRKNTKPDTGNDLHVGASRFIQYECKIYSHGKTIEECATKLIERVKYEENGDIYKFSSGFYKGYDD